MTEKLFTEEENAFIEKSCSGMLITISGLCHICDEKDAVLEEATEGMLNAFIMFVKQMAIINGDIKDE